MAGATATEPASQRREPGEAGAERQDPGRQEPASQPASQPETSAETDGNGGANWTARRSQPAGPDGDGGNGIDRELGSSPPANRGPKNRLSPSSG